MSSVENHLPQSAVVQTNAKRDLPWVMIAWFALLLTITYFPILKHLVEQWLSDEDFTHGLLVPPVAGFIIWQKRAELSEMEWKPAWWGLGLMAWGGLQAYVGLLGAELFLQRTAFLISLVGLLLVLGGTRLVKEISFPLILLIFMIPIPTVVYNRITFPLQLFASQVAEIVLGWINI